MCFLYYDLYYNLCLRPLLRPSLRQSASALRSIGNATQVENRSTLPRPKIGRAHYARSIPAGGDPHRERLERTLEVIESFPPSYREPLLLKSVHGWTQRRIASTLGIPVTAVESRLARARRMLRTELGSRTTSNRPGVS